jgi:hypothetical protein
MWKRDKRDYFLVYLPSLSCSESLNLALLDWKSQMITSELLPLYPEAIKFPLLLTARHVI